MKKKYRPAEIAQIIVTVTPNSFVEEPISSKQLLPLLEEDRESLEAELFSAFEPLQGALAPGELEIREGSVRIILHVLGEIAQWTAVAAGVWQMVEYLRNEIVVRLRNFLRQKHGIRAVWVSANVVPVAVLSLPGVASVPESPGPINLQKYLLISHGVLLGWIMIISALLLLHSL